MKILITGGAGFIGHHIAKKLEDLRHKVSIVDNVYYPFLDLEKLNLLIKERIDQFKNVTIYSYDIINQNSYQNAFINESPNVVIHCASTPNQATVDHDPIYSSRVMIEGVMRTLQFCEKYKVKKFVFLSSSMVYGDFDDNVLELSQCSPNNTYGILKYSGELLVKNFCTKNKIEYTIIRPTSVYGPRDSNNRVLANFFVAAKNNKKLVVNGAEEKLDFTFVDDLVNGIITATFSKNTKNKVYNLSKGTSVKLIDAAEIIKTLVGSGKILIEKKKNDTPSRGSLNNNLAFNDFGYSPKINIEQGLELYYEWIRNSIFWS